MRPVQNTSVDLAQRSDFLEGGIKMLIFADTKTMLGMIYGEYHDKYIYKIVNK